MNRIPKHSEPDVPEPADSVVASVMPDWHRVELARRLTAAERDPGGGLPWEEVRQRLTQAAPGQPVDSS